MDRTGIETEHVVELLEDGHTQSEVARMLGTTKQTVNYHKEKAGWRSPFEVATENLPWDDLEGQAVKATPYARILNHLEFEATGGEHMPPSKLRRLRQWYEGRLLRFNVVVEYRPDIPPTPGQQYGFWRYVPREDRDGDLIIRENEFTQLNDAQKEWFRMPDRLPEV